MGAAMEVWQELGTGFLEAVYHEALGLELTARGIPFEPEKDLLITYKNQPLKKTHKADFIAFGKIIVEIKAMDALFTRDEAQALNYLKATGFRLALLANFGGRGRLPWKRIVR
jgi:GxxExxY protein